MIFRTNFQKQYFRSKTKNNEHHYWIRHIWISLSTSFQLRLTIVIIWTEFPEKGFSHFQSKTDKIDTTIELCIFELVFVSIFTLNKQFWIFGPNLPKKHICSKTEKVNTIIDICVFKLILVPNFSLNWQFWPDLPKKGFSGQKHRKWTQHIFYLILHIQISLMCEISAQTDNFDFLDQICRRYFQSKTESEHHHRIPHIQISLGTKFPLKLKILILLNRFAQKGVFWSKSEKVNTTCYLHNSTYSN